MNKTAQPQSRSLLEQRFGESQIYPVPHPIRDLWQADRCPAALLPHLAWAFSVDYWNENWTEAQKREVVKQAWRTHKHKGTLAALEHAVRPFGLQLRLTEWFESKPQGQPGTFRLDLFGETPLTAADKAEIERLLAAAKPVSRHLAALNFSTQSQGRLKTAALLLQGDILTVYPYLVPELAAENRSRTAAALHESQILTVYAKETR
ncbi:MAG: phage tail protein I [Neisseria sp.]|nr:phage tail protein I [Neisseria sp.]